MTIHNGIDLNSFKYNQDSNFRSKYHLEDKFIVLAVASVWDNTKGLDHLEKLSKELPSNIQLVVVGATNTKDTVNIEKALCIPRTSSVKELCDIYSGADVFMNLTRQDTFPTVNIEAMACGLPVLTYKTGGSPEILTSETGIVIEKNDLDSMKDTIIKLSQSNPFKKEDCIRNASKYSLENMYQEYLELYKKVMV